MKTILSVLFCLAVLVASAQHKNVPEGKMHRLFKVAQKGDWFRVGILLETWEHKGFPLRDKYPVSANVLWGLFNDSRNSYRPACPYFKAALEHWSKKPIAADTALLSRYLLNGQKIDALWLEDTLLRVQCLSYSEQAIQHVARGAANSTTMDKLITLATQEGENKNIPNIYHYACGLRFAHCYKLLQDSACAHFRQVDFNRFNSTEGAIAYRCDFGYAALDGYLRQCSSTPKPNNKPLAVKEGLGFMHDHIGICSDAARVKAWMSAATTNKEEKIAPRAYNLLCALHYELCEGNKDMACLHYERALAQTPSHLDDEILRPLTAYSQTWLERKKESDLCGDKRLKDINTEIKDVKVRFAAAEYKLNEYLELPKKLEAEINAELEKIQRDGMSKPSVRVTFGGDGKGSIVVEFYTDGGRAMDRDDQVFYFFAQGEYKGMAGYEALICNYTKYLLNSVYADGDISDVLVQTMATADGNRISYHSYQGDIDGLQSIEMNYFRLTEQEVTEDMWQNQWVGTETPLLLRSGDQITDWELSFLRAYCFSHNVCKTISGSTSISVTSSIFAYDFPDEPQYRAAEYRRIKARIFIRGMLKNEREALEEEIEECDKIMNDLKKRMAQSAKSVVVRGSVR